MVRHVRIGSSLASLSLLFGALAVLAMCQATVALKPESAAVATVPQPSEAAAASAAKLERVAGRVVWIDEALERRLGVKADPAAVKSAVILETPRDELLPMMPDARGWSFVIDERLRDTDLELEIRRYAGTPLVQVIRVFRRQADGLYELDYWCDICAIAMITLKPCDCCQGPTLLRDRRVEDESILAPKAAP